MVFDLLLVRLYGYFGRYVFESKEQLQKAKKVKSMMKMKLHFLHVIGDISYEH